MLSPGRAVPDDGNSPETAREGTFAYARSRRAKGHPPAIKVCRRHGSRRDELAQPIGQPRWVAQPEHVGIAAILVIALKAADGLEPEMAIKAQGLLVRAPGVAGDPVVLVGHLGDEASTEADPPVLGIDGQKEQVAVTTSRREPDEPLGSVEGDVDRRPSIRAREEASTLLENALACPDALFEGPGRVEVVVVTAGDDLELDRGAHWCWRWANVDISPPPRDTSFIGWRLAGTAMPHRLVDHTADVAVEATGATLGAAFAAAADGMAACQVDGGLPDGGDRFSVSVEAESRGALLFDYLDQLIFERDVRGVLPVDNEATVEGSGPAWSLAGSARGVALDRISAREVKAVTYSDMTIEATADGWRVYVVLDV